MRRTLAAFLSAVFLFLFGLVITKTVGSISHIYVYLAVLVLPSAFALLILYLYGEKGEEVNLKVTATTLKRSAFSFLPALAVCLATSLLTIGVLALFGKEKVPTVLEGTLLRKIVYYALLPAVGEELLFRYIPLRYLSKYGKKLTLFLSAAVFAISHADFFTIPYAFVMGVVFMAVDMTENSVFPSLVFHFGINLISVLFSPFNGVLWFTIAYPLTVLCLGGVCFFILWKKDKVFLTSIKTVIFDKDSLQKEDL